MSVEACEQEVLSLHRFFQEWLRGTAQEGSAERLSNVLAPSFQLVAPGGRIASRQQVLSSVEKGRGTRPKMRIWIENFRVVLESAHSTVVLYEEWQFDGHATTSRLSTAVFSQSEHGVLWQHLHETWCAPEPS